MRKKKIIDPARILEERDWRRTSLPWEEIMDAFERAFARLLVEAMGHEDAARDAYLRAAEFAADPELKKMLTELANRSLDHHDIIEGKMHELRLPTGDVAQ